MPRSVNLETTCKLKYGKVLESSSTINSLTVDRSYDSPLFNVSPLDLEFVTGIL